MSQKELHENLAQTMKKWRSIEDASIVSTGTIMNQTNNPLIRLIMEIILNDSRQHRIVQEFIYRSLVHESVSITPEELAAVSDGIEKHNALENKMVAFVEDALEKMKGKHLLVQEYLLQYLKEDENKHRSLLDALDNIKRGAYPYASS
jgi:hypothetical protein